MTEAPVVEHEPIELLPYKKGLMINCLCGEAPLGATTSEVWENFYGHADLPVPDEIPQV